MSGYLQRVITSAAQPVAVSRRRAGSMPPQLASHSFEPVEDPSFELRQGFNADPSPVQHPPAELPPPNTAMGLPGSDASLSFRLRNHRIPDAAMSRASLDNAESADSLQHDRRTEIASNAAVESALPAADRSISTSRIETGPEPADSGLQTLKSQTSPITPRTAFAPDGLLAKARIRLAPAEQPHALSWQIRALQRHLRGDDTDDGNGPKSVATGSPLPVQAHTPPSSRTAEMCWGTNAEVVKQEPPGGRSTLPSPRHEQRPSWVLAPPAPGFPTTPPAFSGPELVIKNLEVRVVSPTQKASPPSPASEPRVERGRSGAWVSPARYHLGRD